MAVDTASKRFSMLNFGQDDNVMLFEVDGAVDADDRAHLLGLYSGITLSSRVDDKTVSAHVPFELAPGTYTIRLRHQRTDGSDNLEAVAGGSSLSVEVV